MKKDSLLSSGPPVDVPRRPGQVWVWLSDESRRNVFYAAKDKKLKSYDGFFNWSMTYRWVYKFGL